MTDFNTNNENALRSSNEFIRHKTKSLQILNEIEDDNKLIERMKVLKNIKNAPVLLIDVLT